MQCPAPILELSKAARAYGKQPTVLEILVDDVDFPTDLRAWCRASHNTVLSIIEDEGLYVAHVGLNIRGEDRGPASGARAVANVHKAPTPMPASMDARSIPGLATPVPANNNHSAPVPSVAGPVALTSRETPPRVETRREAVDCRGMQCPAPILAVAKKAQQLGKQGGLLEIVATDEQFPSDLKAWCRASKAQLINVEHGDGEIRAVVAVGDVPPQLSVTPALEEGSVSVPLVNVRAVAPAAVPAPRTKESPNRPTVPALPRAKASSDPVRRPNSEPTLVLETAPAVESAPIDRRGTAPLTAPMTAIPTLAREAAPTAPALAAESGEQIDLVPRENRCTILIIKNDFESLMAAMMCASTAAAQGMETAIFFSFWGVNVLRGEKPRVNVKKEKISVLQRMMQWMMPKGPARQKMSKMHMGGMGKGMMQYFMRKNNVLSLEELVASAADQNVKFIVCAMSMGIMGIQKRDIVDSPNVEFAGVATFVELSRRSAMTMVF